MRSPGIWPLVVCVPLVAACRFHFDRNGKESSDALPDAPPLQLSCGVPPHFPVAIAVAGGGSGSGSGSGSAMVTNEIHGFAAIATESMYYAFLVDVTGAVRGHAYGFTGDELVVRKSDAALRSDSTTAVSVVDTHDGTNEGLLVAASYETPSKGTAMLPLDPKLAPRGEPYLNDPWATVDHALARASDGTIALAGMIGDQGMIERVSPLGVPLGRPHEVIADSEQAQTMLIAPAGSRFLVAWQTPADTEGLRARAIDAAFAEAVPAATLNPAQKGSGLAIAYAPAQDRYLFAWYFKESNGMNDDLWVSLRDGNLQELSRAQLSRVGTVPRIASGRDGFLIVWRDNDPSSGSGLSAARVPFDDATRFTSLPVVGHGNLALDYEVVSRAGQTAVAWLENSDTPGTATLWFNALCD